MSVTRNRIAIALTVIGLLQMTGHVMQWPVLRGLGLATGISPFPRVFCENDGYEAFAARYFLRWDNRAGEAVSRELTPAWYSSLKGPYNRRNVYGAALAFAPRLPAELRDAVLDASLAPDSALLRELGVPGDAVNLSVRIEPREGEEEGPWIFCRP